jgi:type IX secretion system substrate protein
MSELDKYFEKARNVEPIYEKDDAKKLLYGKLSDGGIATNLYNKIKAYPMIATLITSVATIATIALLSISSPNTKVAQTSIKNTTEVIDNKDEKPNEKPEDLDWTEEKQPTNQSSVALLSEEKEELNKKPKALNWTEEKIDIKSVNTLKLTKDELAQLGIEIDIKSFKVNAFDKYTYTINQKNEKQRDYYNQDEDRDALPTPAMVTTSTGFKTLTLFKKGNVEATVDRYRSESEDGKSTEKIIAFSKYESEETEILNNGSYSRDLLLRNSDSINVVMLKSYKTTEDGSDVNVLSDRNIEVYTTDMNRKDVDAVIKATLDSLASKNTTLIEVEATEETSSNDPNNRTIYMPLESLEEGKKIKIITEVYEESENINHNETIANDSSPKNKKYELNIESDNGYKKYNILSPKFDYNINELIPIEISFDGVNTDFIVWYEATEEFLTKLPSNLLEKINPELAAISEQAQHCDNAPIEKDNAVMDVWSGCSGAIKEMKVYPNPATSNSNVEFDLDDNRIISIAVYDLSGKLIKNVKSGMSLDKGTNSRPLNLNGVNPGLYYVVVKSDRGEQALQRIIIE